MIKIGYEKEDSSGNLWILFVFSDFGSIADLVRRDR